MTDDARVVLHPTLDGNGGLHCPRWDTRCATPGSCRDKGICLAAQEPPASPSNGRIPTQAESIAEQRELVEPPVVPRQRDETPRARAESIWIQITGNGKSLWSGWDYQSVATLEAHIADMTPKRQIR